MKAVLDNKMKAAGLGGAFASVYSDSGLIGVQAVSSPGEAGQAVDALKATLQGLASVDAGEVKAAQVAAKVGLLSALDSTSASLQMLVSPSLSDVAKIDAVTAESLKAAASGIAGSKLALAAVGDVSSVPRM
uniref:Peptidase M16 C-terminal domain-containing protein n=1 Tax=Fibrocapsa japonica TaxID=94617 RepID=A0A7S2XXG3_9STRA